MQVHCVLFGTSAGCLIKRSQQGALPEQLQHWKVQAPGPAMKHCCQAGDWSADLQKSPDPLLAVGESYDPMPFGLSQLSRF